MLSDLIITTARDLRSVDGENAEYDRALVELTRDLLGVSREEARAAILDRGGAR